MTRFVRNLLVGGALALSLTTAPAVSLTDITVFGADASGNWLGVNNWDTTPGFGFNVWIQNSGGTFLNGPLDAAARPNIGLSLGTTTFNLYAAPGADVPRFGINLLFDGSSAASISAFGPMVTSPGDPHVFAANSSPNTMSPFATSGFAAAGTLSFISGDKQITLTDFFWANPGTYSLDPVGPTTVGANGILDYVGGITFTVIQIPEPQSSLYVLGFLAMLIACRRKRK